MKTLFTLLSVSVLGFANAQTPVKNMKTFAGTPAFNYSAESYSEIKITPSVALETSSQKYTTVVKNVADYPSEGGTILNDMESNNSIDYLSWKPFEFEDYAQANFVTFSNFKAEANGLESTISWKTSEDINTSYFSIERQVSDNEFLVVGTVKTNGTSSSTSYFFIDKYPEQNAMNFYRIVQHYNNGTKEAFGPASVQIGELPNAISWPNPFINSFSILIPQGTLTGKVIITNVFGQTIIEQTIIEDNTTLNLLTEDWKSGTYIITISGPNYHRTNRVMKL